MAAVGAWWRSQAHLAKPLLTWWAVWLLPGVAAALVLLTALKSPVYGALLHLVVLQALMLGLWLPFMPELLQGRLARPLRWALAGLLATAQVGLLGFYALSAVGQQYWGDWLNWDLAAAYAPQVPGLLAALEIPALPVAAALILLWALLFALHASLLAAIVRRRVALTGSTDRRGGVLLLLATVGSLMLFYRAYLLDAEFWWHEPLRQASLNPGFGQAGQAGLLSPLQLQQERDAVAAYQPDPASVHPRPLVLIIVDALRSDQMGVYGGPVDNTPFLSSLARSGALHRIEDAYSVCTVSYCGILGTLSSKYWHQITPQPWNIADALKKFGYQNHYALSGDHTSFYGLRKMFGGSIDLLRDGSDQAGGYNNDDRLVLKTLDETGWPTGGPGFMYIHLMSVHRLGLITDAHKRWDASRAPTEVPNASPFGAMDPRKHAAMRARYHNGILQADDMLRQIFERLARWQVLDDAVVVITADHGEFIGEMDKTSHGQVPYEPVVRIPLLIYDRQAVGTYQPRSLVSQIDIAPTLLAAIGAPAPRNWSGVPLQQATSRSALVLDSAEAGGLVAVLDGTRYKYLRLRDSGQELLFALGAGFAGESVNLAADAGHAAVLAQLRALHTELVGSAPKHDNPAGVAPR